MVIIISLMQVYNKKQQVGRKWNAQILEEKRKASEEKVPTMSCGEGKIVIVEEVNAIKEKPPTLCWTRKGAPRERLTRLTFHVGKEKVWVSHI